MHVTADKGRLDISVPDDIPQVVSAGDEIEFTVDTPENAEGIKVRAWFDTEHEYEGDDELFDDETRGGSLDVSISTEDLEAGDTVRIQFEAWGLGYEQTWAEVRVPVVDEIPSDG